MKIERIEVRTYRLPLDPPFRAAWDPRPRTSFTSTIVRVIAGGAEGVGSGDSMPGFAEAAPLFVGHDAGDIERHVEVLDNLQFHYGRMWPLEVALWDLIAKGVGQPLWKRLGGASGRVRVYASTGERVDARERVASALRLREAGFPALKLRFPASDIDAGVALVRAVREAIGDEMEILVDANQGWRMPSDTTEPWNLDTATRVAERLADLGVYWLEEPLHRHDFAGLEELRRRSHVRIAGGEGARELAELRQYIAHGSLDVYQPDVAWSTGVTRGVRIAQEAQAAGAIYSPHTWGDGLVLLANLHVAAAVSTAPFVEFALDPPNWTPERRDFILPSPIVADSEGCVTLPAAPGLGVEIDWRALEPLLVSCETYA